LTAHYSNGFSLAFGPSTTGWTSSVVSRIIKTAVSTHAFLEGKSLGSTIVSLTRSCLQVASACCRRIGTASCSFFGSTYTNSLTRANLSTTGRIHTNQIVSARGYRRGGRRHSTSFTNSSGVGTDTNAKKTKGGRDTLET